MWININLVWIVFHCCCANELRIGLLLPKDLKYEWSFQYVNPAINMAIEQMLQKILPKHAIKIFFNDTGCSETNAPLSAMDLKTKHNVHMFIGPVCEYALAPVARYSPSWNIPILTAGGVSSDFDDKSQFQLLTRVSRTYTDAAKAFIDIANMFYWTRFGLIYERNNRYEHENLGCNFLMSSFSQNIKAEFGRYLISFRHAFDDGVSDKKELETPLQTASQNARIFVLCGKSNNIRELMIKVHDLKLDNGEHVFLHIDLETSYSRNRKPWYRQNDTAERNTKARKAYESLMIMSQHSHRSIELNKFSRQVKLRTMQQYPNVSFDEGEVSSYVTSFFDAMILYGHAANETLANGGSLTNGTELTARMWNRTFQGITGEVFIDANGDRKADYSLLDMNPNTDEFEEVLTYNGRAGEINIVSGKWIHWPGGFENPPEDTPKCGFDGSKCQTTGVVGMKRPWKQMTIEEISDILQDNTTYQTEAELNQHLIELFYIIQNLKPDITNYSIQCTKTSEYSIQPNTGSSAFRESNIVLYVLYMSSIVFHFV